MVFTLQNLKLGGNLEFSWYSCNILRYCSNRCMPDPAIFTVFDLVIYYNIGTLQVKTFLTSIILLDEGYIPK
jgi:hypothetical protein